MNIEDEDEENDFHIPSEMVDKLYELSGGAEKYKGIIMAVSSENGKPLIYRKFDCAMTQLALSKCLEDFLESSTIEKLSQDEEE
jgi:hypothetical protein